MAEDPDITRRRIYWQCRRGMLELDDLLMGFVDNAYDALTEQEQRSFSDLLKCQDSLLLEYLMGRTIPRDPVLADIINKIRSNAINQ